MLRAGGRRLRLGEDSWEALLRMAAKAAEPPRAKWAQLPAYQKIRSALCGFSCIYIRTLFRHRFSRGSMNGLVLAMRDDMSIQCGCFKPHADDFERNRPRG